MKRKFTSAGIVITLLLGISTFFIACNEDIPEFVRYNGKVVYVGTTNPFSALEVKITNGNKIHCNGYTDEEGQFSLSVKISEIDGSYYLLIGDETCIPQKIQLSGFGQGEVNIGTIEIEGPTLPTVSTKSITNISDNKATSGGNVTFDGRSQVTSRGVCWAKSEFPTTDGDHTENGAGLGEFTSQLTGLEPGSLYYVRAYATNKQGTAYGEQLMLSTMTGLPVVTTNDVSQVSATTAMCGGNVAEGSGYPITARGVCWSDKSATPSTMDSHTEEVAMTGKFTSLIIGLERNTTYYVRAYATNAKGTNYGATKNFTTLSGLPNIITGQISDIKASTALCSGNVMSDGGYPIIARGICWSCTSSTPTISDNHTNEVAGMGAFSSLITNLIPNTTYYVRAYATNDIGTSYGDIVSITTSNGRPKLTTTMPTLNGTTVVSGGNITSDEGYELTARGICYGSLPNPDLSSTYHHTNDGTGTGYFTSSFSLPHGSGKIYIRAYATNENGTAYGDQVTVIQPYDELPTFTCNDNTYKVAPDPLQETEYFSFNNAYSYCESLTAYGYSDWRMPTYEELQAMFQNRSIIGGFYENSTYKIYYWSSSSWNSDVFAECHRWICFKDGGTNKSNYCDESGYSRGSYYMHVRPIRVE